MWRIAILYILFAVFSIAVNIGTQVLCMAVYDGRGAVLFSIFLGTVAGLVAKYALDKRWVFNHVSHDRMHEVRTFALYTAMGLSTTVVFWGTELAFHVLFESDAMRYLGGVAGLTIGYLLKYRLDRRWVFTRVS